MTAYESPEGLLLTRPLNGHGSALAGYAAQVEILESRLGELELQLAEQGWDRLNGEGSREFTRKALGQIIDLARIYYLKNPLIKRSVEIGALYVWGQDISLNAANEDVKAVVDRFWKDNASTLSGQQASRLQEVELQVTGNVFLALFPDRVTGQVRVRQVPVEEIREIVSNPEDRAEVWYYRREWSEQAVGSDAVTVRQAYYPDWRYAAATKPSSITTSSFGEVDVRWESPLLHVKAGAFPHWRWGVPEVYAALDWAKAYKEQLEDDATRSRALARFAWRVATRGGKAGVIAAKTKLGTTLGMDNRFDSNPPPLVGSTFIGDESIGMDPIRIAGATLDPDHSRPARLMAAAATGIPDHFFDPAIGNHATAKTMDRPTELRFNERRQMWRDVLTDLFQWVIDADLAAVRGLLTKALSETDRIVDIAFPDILEPDVTARVSSVVAAATLGGSPEAGTFPNELTSRLLMNALGVQDVDDELANLATEQAAKKAEQAKNPPPPVPPVPGQPSGQQPPNPSAPPVKAGEAKRTRAIDLDGALAWLDGKLPDDLKGVAS